MDNVVHAEFLFSIGTIQIYELKPGPWALFKNSSYFWKYKDGVGIAGPFNSIMEATRNWESTVTKPLLPSNVIKVDFRTKKRIK